MDIEILEKEFAQVRAAICKINSDAAIAGIAARAQVMDASGFVQLSKREGELQRKMQDLRAAKAREGCEHITPGWKRLAPGAFSDGRTSVRADGTILEVEHDGCDHYSEVEVPIDVVIQSLRDKGLV